MTARLYRNGEWWLLERDGDWFEPELKTMYRFLCQDIDAPEFLAADHPLAPLSDGTAWGAPLDDSEVWAAGITYRRSQEGRNEESKTPSLYDRVYDAERPQLFFKCAPGKAVGYGEDIGLRGDSKWIVPEPELVVVCDPKGRIIGYTLGNDVSCRDIEGENALYAPQAKIFRGSCAIGPCLLIDDRTLDPLSWTISMDIERNGKSILYGVSPLSFLKRSIRELIDWLYRYNDFPNGVALMTGTGIVPPPGFSLQDGDIVTISCPPIGTLTNTARVLA